MSQATTNNSIDDEPLVRATTADSPTRSGRDAELQLARPLLHYQCRRFASFICGGIPIGSCKPGGVPMNVHGTFFVFFLVVFGAALILSRSRTNGILPDFPALVALVFGPVLLATLVIQGLGHVFAAKALGVEVRDFVIWPWCGLVHWGPTENAAAEFHIAIAGPLMHMPQMLLWHAVFYLARKCVFLQTLAYASYLVNAGLLVVNFWFSVLRCRCSVLSVAVGAGSVIEAESQEAVRMWARIGIIAGLLCAVGGKIRFPGLNGDALIVIGLLISLLSYKFLLQEVQGVSMGQWFSKKDRLWAGVVTGLACAVWGKICYPGRNGDALIVIGVLTSILSYKILQGLRGVSMGDGLHGGHHAGKRFSKKDRRNQSLQGNPVSFV